MNPEQESEQIRNQKKQAKHISMELMADSARVTSLSMDGGRLVLTIEAELESSNLQASGSPVPPQPQHRPDGAAGVGTFSLADGAEGYKEEKTEVLVNNKADSSVMPLRDTSLMDTEDTTETREIADFGQHFSAGVSNGIAVVENGAGLEQPAFPEMADVPPMPSAGSEDPACPVPPPSDTDVMRETPADPGLIAELVAGDNDALRSGTNIATAPTPPAPPPPPVPTPGPAAVQSGSPLAAMPASATFGINPETVSADTVVYSEPPVIPEPIRAAASSDRFTPASLSADGGDTVQIRPGDQIPEPSGRDQAAGENASDPVESARPDPYDETAEEERISPAVETTTFSIGANARVNVSLQQETDEDEDPQDKIETVIQDPASLGTDWYEKRLDSVESEGHPPTPDLKVDMPGSEVQIDEKMVVRPAEDDWLTDLISEDSSIVGGDRHGEPQPGINFGEEEISVDEQALDDLEDEPSAGDEPADPYSEAEPEPAAAPAQPDAAQPQTPELAETPQPADQQQATESGPVDQPEPSTEPQADATAQAQAPNLQPGAEKAEESNKEKTADDGAEQGGTTVLIRYTCPKCKTQGMQAVDKVGTVVNCSNCGKAMRLVMKR